MRRDWIRIFRDKGLKPLILPALVFGMLVVGFSQYLGDYFLHQEEVDELNIKLDRVRKTVALSKSLEKTKAELMPLYSEIQSRAFRLPNAEDSLDQMQGQLDALLRTLYFENIRIAKSNLKQKSSAMELSVDAQFSGVPQQLPRLEAALEANQKALRIGSIEIKVLDDLEGGGARLEINARFFGLHLDPDEVKAKKS